MQPKLLHFGHDKGSFVGHNQIKQLVKSIIFSEISLFIELAMSFIELMIVPLLIKSKKFFEEN